MWGWGGVPHISKQFSITSWVSYNSAHFWHYLAPVTNPGCCLCFWLTGYVSEVPTTLSFSSINLLKWLTELREIFYLLDDEFIIKGTARWNRCIGQGMGKRSMELRVVGTLPVSPHVHHPGSSLNPVLLVSMKALSHRHDWLKHWPLLLNAISSPAPLPRNQGRGGTESSNCLITRLVPLATSSHT